MPVMADHPGCNTAYDTSRYKVATDHFVNWVVQTSTAHGFDERDHKCPPAPPNHRIEAGPHHRSHGGICGSLIQRSRYLSTHSVHVPRAVLDKLDKAIKLRKKVGSVVRAAGRPDAAADEAHIFFVDALEEARDLLRAIPRRPDGMPVKSDSPGEGLYGVNIYEKLTTCEAVEVEELSLQVDVKAAVVGVHPLPVSAKDDAINVPPTMDYAEATALLKDITDNMGAWRKSHIAMALAFTDFAKRWHKDGEQQRNESLAAVISGTGVIIDLVRAVELKIALFAANCRGERRHSFKDEFLGQCAVHRRRIGKYKKALVKQEAWTRDRVMALYNYLLYKIQEDWALITLNSCYLLRGTNGLWAAWEASRC